MSKQISKLVFIGCLLLPITWHRAVFWFFFFLYTWCFTKTLPDAVTKESKSEFCISQDLQAMQRALEQKRKK